MNNEFFLDTAYAIALSVESDEHHQFAEELAEQLLANQTPSSQRGPYCWLHSLTHLLSVALMVNGSFLR
jgi:predicted nucleic acid-binding protein